MLPCRQAGCKCKGFAWIPSRPEEVGEFWFARRRDFDPSTWRAKCRCKHSHEDHEPVGLRACKSRGIKIDSLFSKKLLNTYTIKQTIDLQKCCCLFIFCSKILTQKQIDSLGK